MAIRVPGVEVGLGYTLDDRELKAYRRQLDDVREKVGRREAFKAQLGADYDARAMRAYERDLQKAEHATNDHIKAQGRLRTSFGSVWGAGGAALAAAGGAAALVAGVKGIVSAYGDAEASSKRVANAVNNAGIAYQTHAKHIDEVIQRQSKLAALDDEDLADSFAKIVGATKDVNQALKLNAVAADVARGRQISLEAANRLVIRAYQGNVGALRRLGIDTEASTAAQDRLKRRTDEQVAALQKQASTLKGPAADAIRQRIADLKASAKSELDAAKATDKAKSGQEAIALLQRRFAGQAAAFGRTQAGAIARLGVAWENLQETLGQRLAPTLTRAANNLARFINQMQDGTGTGGQFVRMMAALGRGFVNAGNFVLDAADKVLAWEDAAEGALQRVAELGSALPGRLGRGFRNAARDIEANRQTLRNERRDLGLLRDPIDDVATRMGRMSKSARGHISALRIATSDATREIKRRLGNDTEDGRKALAANMRQAQTAVERAMRAGTVATRQGMSEIRSLLAQEVKFYGVDIKIPGTHSIPAPGRGITRYMGGWIGQRGQAGPDTVPALLGEGEAVLNRHQQAVIEGLLGDGFLDTLFATVQRPHYLARGGKAQKYAGGGIVPVPGFPGERAASSVIPMIEQIARRFGLTLTDAFGSGHKSPGHTRFGTAADFAGPDRNMDAAVRALVAQGYVVGYDGRFGSQRWPGHGPSTVAGSNAHLHVELGSKGGLGALIEQLKAPRVQGGGQLGRVVQGALNVATRAANSRAAQIIGAPVGGGGGLSSAGGQYNKAALMALWQQAGGPANVANIAAAIALAESGGNPGARNSIGATGLWQIYNGPGTSLGLKDPMANARAAVAKWRAAGGFTPWTTYTGADTPGHERTYLRYLARGGFLRRFARGGRAGAPKARVLRHQDVTIQGSIPNIRSIVGRVNTGVRDFDTYMQDVDDDGKRYTEQDRRYNLTDEVLIDPDDGSVNVAAVKRRAYELEKLINIRFRIQMWLVGAQRTAQRVVRSLRTILRRLNNSLRFANKKQRAGIRSQIRTYRDQLKDWQGKAHDLGFDITDAKLDVSELQKEKASVLGTTAETQPADPGADLGTTSTAADTGTDTTTADPATAPPSAQDIATAAIAEYQSFQSSRADLFGQGSNFYSRAQALGRGGLLSGNPDVTTAAAGMRAFGATGGTGLGTGTVVNAYFASAPDNAPTFIQQVRFVAEGA